MQNNGRLPDQMDSTCAIGGCTAGHLSARISSVNQEEPQMMNIRISRTGWRIQRMRRSCSLTKEPGAGMDAERDLNASKTS